MSYASWCMSLICYVSSTSCFIYQLEVLKKGDRYIIGFSDWHDRVLPINRMHRIQLLSFLQKFPIQNCKVLIEDASGQHGIQGGIRGPLNFFPTCATLAAFTHECKSHNIDICNLEYRYCRIASIGPLLYKKRDCISSSSFIVQDILNEVVNTIQEISSYSDIPLLKTLYRNAIMYVKNNIIKLQLAPHQNETLLEYCQHISPERLTSLLKTLLTFDSPLLDCRILHAIVSHSKQHTVILAGGTHVERVCTILKGLGYTSIYKSSTHKKIPPILNRSILFYPSPINMGILNRFLS